MKKKQIIAWSVVVGAIISIVLICTMVFTLRKVDFQLTAVITENNRSRLFAEGKTREDVESKIKDTAQLNIGGNLLFMNFDANISKIEKANPFVRIEKIVRHFPNKITIYYSEREAVGLVKKQNVEGAYLVIDSTLKVLDQITQTDIDQGKYKLPIIDFFGQSFQASAGDFINSPLSGYVKQFVSGAFSANGINSALYEDVMAKTSGITIKDMEENNPNKILVYTMTANNGSVVNIEVWSADSYLFDKVAYSWKVFTEVISKRPETDEATLLVMYKDGKPIVVDKANQDTEITANI